MLSLEDLRDKYAKELIGGKCSFIQRKGDYKVRGRTKKCQGTQPWRPRSIQKQLGGVRR